MEATATNTKETSTMRDERAIAYIPPIANFKRTGNAALDYMNAVRIRNGKNPLTLAQVIAKEWTA